MIITSGKKNWGGRGSGEIQADLRRPERFILGMRFPTVSRAQQPAEVIGNVSMWRFP